MAITNAILAQKIVDLIDVWNNREAEFQAWLNGVVGGGDNSDGEYPLTDYEGITLFTKSPAQLEEDVSSLVTGAAAHEVAASASAVAAASSAVDATTQASLASGYRVDSVAAQGAAETAQSAAESARTTAIAQAVNSKAWAQTVEDTLVPNGDLVDDYSSLHWAAKAAASAAAGAASETAAGTSETNAAASETAAAASAVTAASFDPAAFYTRVALDAGQLDNRYFTESEVTASLALKANTHSHPYEAADATILKDADIGVTVAAFSHSHTEYLGQSGGTWPGIAPSGSEAGWVRTPQSGLLPNASGGASGSLGSPTWKFELIHGVTIYENGTSLAAKYSLLSHTHTGVYEPAFSKLTAFNKNFGTSGTTIAYGNHAHSGVYAPQVTVSTLAPSGTPATGTMWLQY